MRIPRFPLVLALCGAAGVAAALWWPSAETRPVYGAIDLNAGALTIVEFDAARDVNYRIGVEMEQEAAERLFPCTAGRTDWGPGECLGEKLPISLEMTLFENGSERSELVRPNTATSGGSYVYDNERPTYTWHAAHARLSSGRRYRLEVRSLTDGTAAMAADPRLIVYVNPVDTLGEAIIRYFGLWLAAGAIAIGGFWALIFIWLRKRQRASGAS